MEGTFPSIMRCVVARNWRITDRGLFPPTESKVTKELGRFLDLLKKFQGLKIRLLLLGDYQKLANLMMEGWKEEFFHYEISYTVYGLHRNHRKRRR